MIPILFPHDNLDFLHMGKGKLGEIISCVVHEELNGDYSMEFEYPITGLLYKELLNGGTVGAWSPTISTHFPTHKYCVEFFDIYKHSLPIDGVVKFYCNHVSRRLANSVFCNSTLTESNFWTYSNPNDFDNLGTKRYTSGTIATGSVVLDAPKSLLSCLIGEDASLVSFGNDMAFGCESYVYSSPYNGVDMAIMTLQHRGEDNGAEVRFGYNMLDIEHTEDLTGTYNALVPFWDDGNGNKTFATGYVVQPTTPITPIIAVPYDATNDFQTQPTSAELVTLAQSILDGNTPWIGEETLTVDFVNGAEIDPHGADIRLGDTVHVYWLDADIASELRVVSYDWDCLTESYLKMELGKQATNFVAVTGIDASGGGGGGSVPAPVISPYDSTPANLGTASPGVSDDYARGDHVHAYPEWTYLGSSTNSSTTVSYPTTAHEILVVGKITHNGGATEYSATFRVASISDRDRLQIGGYYYGSSDYGIASVNHDSANHTLAFRNLRYVSTTSGTFYFYYR